MSEAENTAGQAAQLVRDRFVVGAHVTDDKGKAHPLYLSGDMRRPLTYHLAQAVAWNSIHDARGLVATFDYWVRRFGIGLSSTPGVLIVGKDTAASGNSGEPPVLGPEASVKPVRDFSGRDGS